MWDIRDASAFPRGLFPIDIGWQRLFAEQAMASTLCNLSIHQLRVAIDATQSFFQAKKRATAPSSLDFSKQI